MKISARLLPIKLHYFFFLGSVAPVLPFLMVVGIQLGVPVQVQGSLNALVLIVMVFVKPLIAVAADSFPSFRKAIFLLLIVVMVTCFSSISLIQPFTTTKPPDKIVLQGKFVSDENCMKIVIDKVQPDDVRTEIPKEQGSRAAYVCFVTYDRMPDVPVYYTTQCCVMESACDGGKEDQVSHAPPSCFTLAYHIRQLKHNTSREERDTVEEENYYIIFNTTQQLPDTEAADISIECDNPSIYRTPQMNHPWSHYDNNSEEGDVARTWQVNNTITNAVGHGGATEDGYSRYYSEVEAGLEIWSNPGFYAFAFLMFTAVVAFSTTNSITDAICLDTIGSDGNYGAQRVWGSVGWGVIGLASGALVDWWSEDSLGGYRNYAPAFLLLLLLGAVDLAVSAVTLTVPKYEEKPAVWRNVSPLLHEWRFVLFLFFVVINGCLDGIVANFIFVLQEEIAQGTPVMCHIKLLQGLTMVVQSAAEIPLMFLCDRLSKRFGADRLTTIVFAAYSIRILLLSLMGYLGNAWLTLLAELLNGPCFGLGYTAIVLYAGQISAPGTSATVQSMVNICYEAIGYALSSFVGGFIIQKSGGAANYLVFGIVAAVACPLHYAFTRAFPAPLSSDTNQQSEELAVTESPKAVKMQEIQLMLPSNIPVDTTRNGTS